MNPHWELIECEPGAHAKDGRQNLWPGLLGAIANSRKPEMRMKIIPRTRW
jgi:hypothetical protein